MDTEQLVEHLGLRPHPEGGWFRETFRSGREVEGPHGPRAALTSILFLLPPGGVSAWHVVRSDEVWNLLRGTATLHRIGPAGRHDAVALGPDLGAGQQLQAVVPADDWQATVAGADGPALFGCQVGPGFDFADFMMPDVAAFRAAWPHLDGALEALCRA